MEHYSAWSLSWGLSRAPHNGVSTSVQLVLTYCTHLLHVCGFTRKIKSLTFAISGHVCNKSGCCETIIAPGDVGLIPLVAWVFGQETQPPIAKAVFSVISLEQESVRRIQIRYVYVREREWGKESMHLPMIIKDVKQSKIQLMNKILENVDGKQLGLLIRSLSWRQW